MGLQLLRFETPQIAHFSWLLASGGEAAIVDPRRDIDDYLAAARGLGVRLRYVIETHRQEDFVMGSRNLRDAVGAQVVNGRDEHFGRGDLRLGDGESFTLGDLRIEALHTPGHTPESMCWAVYPSETPENAWGVFTGDTLFFGSTGRSDLIDRDKAGDHAALLWDSVHAKLARLNDSCQIFPAHGPGSVCGGGMAARPFSTIGLEKGYNPVFRQDRGGFAADKGLQSMRMPRPPYFRLMEKVNLEGGLPPAPDPAAIPRLAPPDFKERAQDAVVVDTREPEAFAAAHIDGAHAIWLGGLPVFGGWVAGRDDALCLVQDSDAELETAWRHLSRIGLDNIRAVLAGGFGAWRSSARGLKRSGAVWADELRESPELQILDVREEGEFAAGHIGGARHCYVGHLEARLDRLDLDPHKPVVVTCSVGHRAGLAASILLRRGFPDVRNLLGGMKRWQALGRPVEKEG